MITNDETPTKKIDRRIAKHNHERTKVMSKQQMNEPYIPQKRNNVNETYTNLLCAY